MPSSTPMRKIGLSKGKTCVALQENGQKEFHELITTQEKEDTNTWNIPH